MNEEEMKALRCEKCFRFLLKFRGELNIWIKCPKCSQILKKFDNHEFIIKKV